MKQHIHQAPSKLHTKNVKENFIIDNSEQKGSDITKITIEAMNYQQSENLPYENKNFQNDTKVLKEIHDKVECYLPQTHIGHINLVNKLNFILNENIKTTSFRESSASIQRKKVPFVIQREEPIFEDMNIVLRYSLYTNFVLCSLKYNTNGSQFVFSDGRAVFFVNSKDGSINWCCNIPVNKDLLVQCLYIKSICFSPDSQYLALGCQDNKIIVINSFSQNIIATLELQSKNSSALSFSIDSKFLYSGGCDGRICLWNLNTMKLHKSFQPKFSDNNKKNESVVNIAISSNESILIVGYDSGRIVLIDLMLDHVIETFYAHQKGLISICTRRKIGNNLDSTFITTSKDKTTKIWEFNHHSKCKNTLNGHNDYVITSCLSPNDPLILTGSKDETIKGWDEETGKLLFTLRSHNNTIFQVDHHPSDKTFISCSGDGIICVWDYTISKQYENPE